MNFLPGISVTLNSSKDLTQHQIHDKVKQTMKGRKVKKTVPSEILNFIVRKDILDLHSSRIDPSIKRKVHDIDYGESDGSGTFTINAVYCPSRKALYWSTIETTGDYAKQTGMEILKMIS